MSLRLAKVLAGLLFFLLPLSAQADGPTFRFEHLGEERGLSQNSGSVILQDRQGFIWIGTLDGLNKYDGYTFTVYKPDPADPNSISDKFINALREGRDGSLWIGTDSGGLNRFDPTTETFSHYTFDPADPASLSNDIVMAVYEDRAGTVWVGTLEGGLNRLDRATGKFTRYQHNPDDPTSLSDNWVSAIYEDQAGTLWIGTAGGLNRFDPASGTFTTYRHDPANPASLSDNHVNVIYQDRAGTLWIGTAGGLNRLDPASGTFTAYWYDPANPASLSHDDVLAILEDRDGRFWVGTRGGGLNWFDRAAGTFRAYRHQAGNPAGLSSNIILALYQDASGVLWIGTQAGGVDKLNPQATRFALYQSDPATTNSLSGNNVWSVYEDRFGIVWIGTDSGLNRLDPATQALTHYRHHSTDPFSLPNDVVIGMVEDGEGTVWVGTDGGLSQFDRSSGNFKTYRNDPANPASISSEAIGALLVDREGRLWVGTGGGGALHLFNPGSDSFTVYRNDPADPASLPGSGIWAIAQDRAGYLWVGTGGSGLARFDPASGDAQTYSYDPARPGSLSQNIVLAVYEDRAGTLWVGTFGGGLNKFNRESETFTVYTEKDGLANNNVLGIEEDEQGRLWISTVSGLSCFDPATEKFKNYNAADGLQGNEFNARSHYKNKAGRMFFGGINGLTVFDPAKITGNTFIPPVILTSFQKFNQPVKLDRPLAQLDTLDLSYQDSVFSFEFAALDYTDPAANQYAYKLEGFDRDWIQAGTRRFATYTNLPGGSYTFRVRGSNNDGVWNEKGTSIRLYISTPPWLTWWAFSLYGLLAAGLVVAFVKLRTMAQARELEGQRRLNERLREVDRLKDEFLASTSHELRTPLNGIIGLSEALIEGATGPLPERTVTNLQMIASSGRRLVGLVNNILDYAKLRHHDLVLQTRPVDMHSLTGVILKLCTPLVGQKPVELYNYIPQDVPLVDADENRIQQIMYNLIGNAIKFTEVGCVEVTAEVIPGSEGAGEMLAVTVADTGTGIPADKLELIFEPFEQANIRGVQTDSGTGLGLAVTRQLVDLHGGQLRVESTPGQGSRFTFTLPLSTHITRQLAKRPSLLPSPLVKVFPLASETPVREVPAWPDDQTGRAKILVVDDDPINLQVLASHLELQHYRVYTALNGLEALADIQGDLNPDLVILDVMMPWLSGLEVCRLLRQKYSLFDLPVLLLTAKNQVEDLVAGIEAGANDYLCKPFDKRELVARVNTLLILKRLNLDLRQEIDKRRRAQAELQKINDELELRVQARTAELAQLVQDLNAFSSTVAHDLKNPVAIILGYTGVLSEDLRSAASAQQLDMLQSITQTGRKMNTIIQSLLFLSSVRQQEIQVTEVDMSYLVVEVELRLEQLIAEYQAVVIKPAIWPLVWGHAAWLEEVWFNYMSNAIKYGGRPPRLELGATPQPNGMIRFWARDNGPGLTPEQQAQLFVPFKRLDTSHATEGHGLGLSIVQRIIQKLGGHVGVESNNQGSTFYFTLPAVQQ